jgi:hypothetical protein
VIEMIRLLSVTQERPLMVPATARGWLEALLLACVLTPGAYSHSSRSSGPPETDDLFRAALRPERVKSSLKPDGKPEDVRLTVTIENRSDTIVTFGYQSGVYNKFDLEVTRDRKAAKPTDEFVAMRSIAFDSKPVYIYCRIPNIPSRSLPINHMICPSPANIFFTQQFLYG